MAGLVSAATGGPTELPKFNKGDQLPAGWFFGGSEFAYRWRALSASGGGSMAASKINFTEPGRMYESILVGTSKRNARFIEIVHKMAVTPVR